MIFASVIEGTGGQPRLARFRTLKWSGSTSGRGRPERSCMLIETGLRSALAATLALKPGALLKEVNCEHTRAPTGGSQGGPHQAYVRHGPSDDRHRERSSFRHAGFHSSTSEAASGSTSPQHEQEAASPSCWEEFRRRDEVAADQNFDDFVNSDADAKEDLDDEEIVQLVSGAQEEPEDANGPDTVEAPVPTLSQVMDAVDLLRRFAGAHEGAEERFDFTVQL
ncbi:hypothetical protein MTO96_010389 [Rhipicephalus appendiculatus]